jgi:hypothetical protein
VSLQAASELLCMTYMSLADAVAVEPPAGMLIDRLPLYSAILSNFLFLSATRDVAFHCFVSDLIS